MTKVIGLAGVVVLVVILVAIALVQYTIWKNAD
ncbi:hypothetical protein AWB78_04507 [Caballeronia calidae]|uniref:Uncharacterized protein n=1 Tax=Caballeronia calidae TaxID=1777139 RepID=A0A158CY03_9BURK|nr:hypothetical protein AWB78_04507 [Caballeronia calidae]